MNILYIGPYIYNDFNGMAARNIIESISKNKEVEIHTRNIFLNNPYDNLTLVNYHKFEKELLPKYDIVIQHTYPSMMVKDISIAEKFIAIPIVDYMISSYDIDILKSFDEIYVDDQMNLSVFKKAIVQSKIFSYDFEKIVNTNRINLDYHNFNKKFYFIGNYSKNQNTINKIIVSFLIAFRSYQGVSLILMLTDTNKTEVEKNISSNISDIFSKMDFKSVLSPIRFIVQPLNIEELHTIHSSFDTYIDIRDSYDTGVNTSLAQLYNRNIIDIQSLDTISVPSIDLKDGDTNRYKQSVLTQSIIDAMTNDNTKNTTHVTKTIVDLLCI